jgi:acyl carrier protein
MSAERTLPSVANPSRAQVLEDVKRIVADVLGVASDDVQEQNGLDSDLGCDSLDFVEIITSVEDHFGITIPEEHAEEVVSVGDIVDGVQRLLSYTQVDD